MTTATGYATSYDTFWGNAIQGFYINWEHSALKEGIVKADSKMTFTVDLRLYSVASVFDTSVITAGTEELSFYILF